MMVVKVMGLQLYKRLNRGILLLQCWWLGWYRRRRPNQTARMKQKGTKGVINLCCSTLEDYGLFILCSTQYESDEGPSRQYPLEVALCFCGKYMLTCAISTTHTFTKA